MAKNWLIVVLVMLSEIAVTVNANATEEPAWALRNTLDDVELRQYEPVIQARTSTPAGVKSSSGFR